MIAIIGILAAVLMASFGDARTAARNRTLSAAMKEVQLALEVYEAQHDRYPVSISDLRPEFLTELPVGSEYANPACNFTYHVDGDGRRYKYVAERCFGGATNQSEGVQPTDELARCPSTCSSCDGISGTPYQAQPAFYESYAVYSQGATCATP